MASFKSLLQFLAVLPAVSAIVPKDGKDFDYNAVSLREVGARNTVTWRIWLEYDGNPISFWHDIPLCPDANDKSIINTYTEIPRWTDGKIETSRDEPLNPIFHDMKKKKPKFVYSVWPYRSYPFNYGSIPQTWGNAEKTQNYTQLPGDNDPIDIFEISSLPPAKVGEIRKVKILGGLPLIDDNKSDWKVIVIDINDPVAKLVNCISYLLHQTIEDLDKYRPNVRQEFYDWFTFYKVVKGDGVNTIIGNGYRNAAEVQDLIAESHEDWKDLVRSKNNYYINNEISINQTSHPSYCKSYVSSANATSKFNTPTKSNILPAEARPTEYDEWYYLDKDYNLITV
ncbi:unnamed protein product [Clonostachys rosea]|uniref:inorganic diphosphatase n=1 Tax=Bionectria ochroleuca TaxID=29856 RepID=A0ABY6U9B6_BIOOC|nr:unnamed protein product [Clonostachys rosea]